MFYAGLDVHWKKTTYCILDGNGKMVQAGTIKGTWEKVLQRVADFPRPFAVCYEASTGYGFLYERLTKLATRVVVAHPGQLRLIFRSKKKNDRVDAEKLAKLLFLDEVPVAHVPSGEVRSWRAFIEHRHRLVCEQTRIKNSLRSLLKGHGVEAPKGLWSRQGRRWLAQVSFSDPLAALQRDLLAERLDTLSGQLQRTSMYLDQRALAHPAVHLAMTIPGVGVRTAEAVSAYLDDPGRFHNNKAVGRYFGLVPAQDASGSVNRLGHITKEGPSTVRRLATEAAWQGIRRSPRIKAYYERIQKGDPTRKKIALVATAHYLLRVMLAMLKTGETWCEEAA